MEGESLSMCTYNHIALKTDEAGLEKAKRAIENLGLEIKPSPPRVEGEGQSLYFYTHDNHLLKLHTGTLQERLKRYSEASNGPFLRPFPTYAPRRRVDPPCFGGGYSAR